MRSYDDALNIGASADVHARRAHCHERLDRPNDALVDWNWAIIYRPDFAAAYLARADILERQGRAAEALQDRNQAAALSNPQK